MTNLKTLDNIRIQNKLILLRIDINSPVLKGRILDNPRFSESAKTIKYLLSKKAKIAILAHQGRLGSSDFMPLSQHAKLLSKYIGKKINYVDDLFGKKSYKSISSIKAGQAILLKNVRAYKEESDVINPKNNYKELCKIFDIYINDAFSASHRKQASILIPPKVLSSYIGLGFQKELQALKKFNFESNKSVFLIGGSKIEDYLPLFNVLKNKNNKIIASGVLANLLLSTKDHDLGYENIWLKERGYFHLLPKLKSILKKYEKQIILPIDFAIGNKDILKTKRRKEISLNEVPVNEKILDVGHKTVESFKSYLKDAKSIFMKGPLGYSEIAKFSYATIEILKYISKLSKERKIFSLLGGGHLSTTIKKYKIKNNFSYVSLAGGALIKYLSGEELPGITALQKNAQKFH